MEKNIYYFYSSSLCSSVKNSFGDTVVGNAAISDAFSILFDIKWDYVRAKAKWALGLCCPVKDKITFTMTWTVYEECLYSGLAAI